MAAPAVNRRVDAVFLADDCAENVKSIV